MLHPPRDELHEAVGNVAWDSTTGHEAVWPSAGLRVFCGTWNVNGQAPAVPLEEWFSPLAEKDDVDIFVIALQEVQDLSGTSALITDDEKGLAWSLEVQRALGAPEMFLPVAVRQMVGIYLMVLARASLAPHISNVKITELGTGLRLCVVSSHLAAQTGNVHRRNQDFREMVQRLDFNAETEPPMPTLHLLPPSSTHQPPSHPLHPPSPLKYGSRASPGAAPRSPSKGGAGGGVGEEGGGKFRFGAIRMDDWDAARGRGRAVLTSLARQLSHNLKTSTRQPSGYWDRLSGTPPAAPTSQLRQTAPRQTNPAGYWDHLSGNPHGFLGGDKKDKGKDAWVPSLAPVGAIAGPALEPLRILDHDVVLWLGDLNYRIALPDAAVLALIEERAWGLMTQFDQLHQQRRDLKVFEGFEEAALAFAPTYKYETWGRAFATDDDGGLKRTPAWCDRVLYKASPAFQTRCEGYRRHEIIGSDHRPVSSIIRISPNSAHPPSQVPPRGQSGPASARKRSAAEESARAARAATRALERAGGEEEGGGESGSDDFGDVAAPVAAAVPARVRMIDTHAAFLFLPAPGPEAGPALLIDKATRQSRWLPTDHEDVVVVTRGKGSKRPPKERMVRSPPDAAAGGGGGCTRELFQVHGVLGVVALSHVHYLAVAVALEGVGVLPGAKRLVRVSETLLLPISVGPPISEGTACS
ncbi:Endonuclease/exonuclease/phosphatase [Baffinella frigidus]|nr:Endonuclease/exonuclease/phosphatase [Cryptophyta sp. CCMP2293]